MQSDEVHDWIIHWLPKSATTGDDRSQSVVEVDGRVTGAIQRALMSPQGGMPLREQVGPGTRVTVAIDPSDDQCPNALMLPAVMEELRAAHVRDSDVTVLLAHDFRAFDAEAIHDPITSDATMEPGIRGGLSRYNVVRHDPYDLQSLNQLGTFQHVPLSVNYVAAESDYLIATGSVHTHRQMGYTGGMYTVGVGCSGIAAVNEMFGSTNLDDPRVRTGVVQGNPVYGAMQQAAMRAGLAFSIECSGYGGDEFVVRAGNPARVNEAMVDMANFRVQLIAPLSRRDPPLMQNPFESFPRPALKSALARPLPTFVDEMPD